MIKIIMIGAICTTLAACNTTAQSINDTAKEIQGYVTTACRFVPTLATITAILTNTGDGPRVIADKVCNAVTTIPLADGPGDGLPRAYGIVIKGKRI